MFSLINFKNSLFLYFFHIKNPPSRKSDRGLSLIYLKSRPSQKHSHGIRQRIKSQDLFIKVSAPLSVAGFGSSWSKWASLINVRASKITCGGKLAIMYRLRGLGFRVMRSIMIQKGIMVASAGLIVVFLIAVLGRAHSTVVLITPSNESIPFPDIEASFAPRISGAGIMGVVYVANPLNACMELSDLARKTGNYSPILLVERGGCTFELKARIAQEAGYEAVIVYNDEDGEELVTMSGDSAGIRIYAVFVTKETANMLLHYVKDMDTICYILPAYENTAWSVMAVSFLSLLAVSAVLLTFFFVRRYRIRHFSSRFLLNREARGLSSREVKALPAVIYKTCDTSGTDTCAICLESYEVGEKLRILPCHHGTTLACCLPKGRNCIAIEKDPVQCKFIQQRIKALEFLPDVKQEDGLRKEDFNESRVAKKTKEPQPPLNGMIGKGHFIRFIDMKDPLEDDNDQNEVENVAEEAINDVLDDVEHVLVDIVDDL